MLLKLLYKLLVLLFLEDCRIFFLTVFFLTVCTEHFPQELVKNNN